VLKNVLLTAVGLALIGLARLAFNTVALNAFDETLAGQLNVALSLSVLLSLPASTAFGATTVRFMAQARGQGRPGAAAWIYRTTLAATIIVATAGTVAALGARSWLSHLQGVDEALVFQAVELSVAYVSYLFFRNVLYALDRVKLYTYLEVGTGTVFFVTLSSLALLGRGHTLLTAFLASWVAFSVAGLWLTRAQWTTPCPPEERTGWRPLASYSLLALVGTASSLCVRELAVFFAPAVADLGGAAHLALSMSLLAPLQFFPRMLRTALFAHSAELDGRGQQAALAGSLGAASHWLLLATVPACAVLALGAAPILTALGGTATPERLLVFRLLTAAALVDVVATPASNALPGVGNVKAPAYAALGALVLTIAAWWWLTPILGFTGLAVGMLLNSVVKGAVPIYAARVTLGARLTHAPGRVGLLGLGALGGLALLAVWPQPLVVTPAYALAAALVLWRPGAQLWRELRGRMTRLRAPRAPAAAP